eukprot:761102-Hanusia_phi.AAC.1
MARQTYQTAASPGIHVIVVRKMLSRDALAVTSVGGIEKIKRTLNAKVEATKSSHLSTSFASILLITTFCDDSQSPAYLTIRLVSLRLRLPFVSLATSTRLQ